MKRWQRERLTRYAVQRAALRRVAHCEPRPSGPELRDLLELRRAVLRALAEELDP